MACVLVTLLLLVFSVTPFKIDQNKNQNRSIDKGSRIWEMKGGTYAKTLTKIQVRGIFRIRDNYPKECFTQNYRDLYDVNHASAHLDELQHGGRKPT